MTELPHYLKSHYNDTWPQGESTKVVSDLESKLLKALESTREIIRGLSDGSISKASGTEMAEAIRLWIRSNIAA